MRGRARARRVEFATVLALLMFAPAIARSQEMHVAPGSSDFAAHDSLRVWQDFFALTGISYQHGASKGDVGLGGSRIKEIVRTNPMALAQVHTFAHYQIPTFFGGIVSAGVAGAGFGADKKVLKIAGLSGVVVSLVLDQIGYGHLKKAVANYNGRP